MPQDTKELKGGSQSTSKSSAKQSLAAQVGQCQQGGLTSHSQPEKPK